MTDTSKPSPAAFKAAGILIASMMTDIAYEEAERASLSQSTNAEPSEVAE